MAVAPLQEKLAARRERDSATQQLKTATVLFMDVVGSTRLSERLDPEDTHAVMDSALERLTAIVRAHQGRVLQYAGDSLLAVFGADQALEDDAERAVRAGLAIVAEAAPLAAGFRASFGLDDFALRVGIHTGPVLLGGGIDAEGSIRGVTVNIAARMEQTAPAGALRISHETYRHVRGVFDVEPQAPIEIKGITGPVRSYLVTRAKPRAFRMANRGLEGIETQMVGRDAELARIGEAFLGACEDKSPAPGDDRRRARHRQEPPRPRVHALARAQARAGPLLPGPAAAVRQQRPVRPAARPARLALRDPRERFAVGRAGQARAPGSAPCSATAPPNTRP